MPSVPQRKTLVDGRYMNRCSEGEIETRAAEIALDTERLPLHRHADGAEISGWIIWVNDLPAEPVQPGELAGYLAAAIFNHDTEARGEPSPFDRYNPDKQPATIATGETLEPGVS